MIQIIVNGVSEKCNDGMSIGELLKSKTLEALKVVVEVNQQIVRRDVFDSHKLNSNDRVEILRFVGGG
jgi:sulfur carrier protein